MQTRRVDWLSETSCSHATFCLAETGGRRPGLAAISLITHPRGDLSIAERIVA